MNNHEKLRKLLPLKHKIDYNVDTLGLESFKVYCPVSDKEYVTYSLKGICHNAQESFSV